MKTFFRRLHLWLSAPLGILITLICFSGAMLVFENDITDLSLTGALRVDPQGRKALPLSELMARVAPHLPDSATVSGVQISPDASQAYRFNISGRGHRALIVDQYTGEVKALRQRNAFFRSMHSLHGALLDKKHYAEGEIKWGQLFVGISTLLFLLALISGIIVWWPRSRKALANSFKITARYGARRFWLSMHDALGVYALLFLLAMSITGLTWSFDWFGKGFYAIIGASEPVGAHHGAPARKSGKNMATDPECAPDYAAWQIAADGVAAANPGRTLTVKDGEVTVNLGSYGNARAADSYKFDTNSGSITGVDRYQDSPRRKKAGGWVGAFHTGTWGGLVSKILYFLAALIGATLPLTGYWLWIKRQKGRQ